MAEILRQRARHYPNCSKMVKQVEKMQRFFKDLQPSVKRYTHDNGHSEELANLTGTIPAYYKGKQYNFPIEMWLLTSFPESAPLVFVRPTSTMSIRQGRHVDANGKVYLPYLNEWSASRSNLNGLLGVIATCFGSDPPVVARSQAAPPARPPQPTGGAGYPAGPPAANSYWSRQQGSQNAPGSGYPSQPPAYPVPTSGAGYPPSTGAGYPPTSGAGYQPPSYPQAPNAYQPYPPATGYPSQPSQAAATPYPAGPAYAAAQQSSPNFKSDSIGEDVILMSIRDSTNDILKRRFVDINAQSRSEVDTLKSTENELKHGKSKLDEMMNQIESEKASCEEEIRKCQRIDEEMTRELQSLNDSQEINPEDIITPSNPIYKQIFTHHNKEQAIEDAIYFLNKALLRGSIDAETFLRTVRQLSRTQFEHKTIVIKARKRANLA